MPLYSLFMQFYDQLIISHSLCCFVYSNTLYHTVKNNKSLEFPTNSISINKNIFPIFEPFHFSFFSSQLLCHRFMSTSPQTMRPLILMQNLKIRQKPSKTICKYISSLSAIILSLSILNSLADTSTKSSSVSMLVQHSSYHNHLFLL